MEKKTATPAAQRAYDKLVESLAGSGAVASTMFGMPTLKVGTKAFAGLYADGASFRLVRDTPEHTSAMALAGAELFDPSGMGRAMKDWVYVPAAHAKNWAAFAEVAMARLD
jgi:hypothetical protein